MYIDDKNYVIKSFHTAYLQKILMGNEKRPEFNFNFQRQNKAYVINHIKSMELLREIEDEMKCSGICKSSIFYYGLKLDKGKPTKTCLLPLKEAIFG